PLLARRWKRIFRSDRLRPYVRSVDAAHMAAAKMGSATRFPNKGATSWRPLDPAECLASGIDRSLHLLLSCKVLPRMMPSRISREAQPGIDRMASPCFGAAAAVNDDAQ